MKAKAKNLCGNITNKMEKQRCGFDTKFRWLYNSALVIMDFPEHPAHFNSSICRWHWNQREGHHGTTLLQANYTGVNWNKNLGNMTNQMECAPIIFKALNITENEGKLRAQLVDITLGYALIYRPK